MGEEPELHGETLYQETKWINNKVTMGKMTLETVVTNVHCQSVSPGSLPRSKSQYVQWLLRAAHLSTLGSRESSGSVAPEHSLPGWEHSPPEWEHSPPEWEHSPPE